MSSAFAAQRACASASFGLVAGLGGGDDVGGDQDVLAQLPGQLVAGRLAVERLDGVADVGLVPEQPADRGVGVGRAGRRG